MELRIHSDTHLEAFIGVSAGELVGKFFPVGDREWEQVLVLCGDICSVPYKTNQILMILASRFRHVIYAPGNHEYYHSTIPMVNDQLRQICERIDNVSIAHKSEVQQLVIDDVRFVYGTLWTDPMDMRCGRMPITNYLNDFRVIGDFSIHKMAELHRAQKQQLQDLVETKFDGATVVITHHLPSFSLCDPRFGGKFDHGFASDCDSMLKSGDISLWCHGHTHDFIDTTIGGTRVVCNPTGYRGEWGNTHVGGGILTVSV